MFGRFFKFTNSNYFLELFDELLPEQLRVPYAFVSFAASTLVLELFFVEDLEFLPAFFLPNILPTSFASQSTCFAISSLPEKKNLILKFVV